MQILTIDDLAGNVSGMPADERKSETLAFRVTKKVYDFVNDLAKAERRRLSEVETAIFERGIAAYERDGLLFEPVKPHSQEERSKLPTTHKKTG